MDMPSGPRKNTAMEMALAEEQKGVRAPLAERRGIQMADKLQQMKIDPDSPAGKRLIRLIENDPNGMTPKRMEELALIAKDPGRHGVEESLKNHNLSPETAATFTQRYTSRFGKHNIATGSEEEQAFIARLAKHPTGKMNPDEVDQMMEDAKRDVRNRPPEVISSGENAERRVGPLRK